MTEPEKTALLEKVGQAKRGDKLRNMDTGEVWVRGTDRWQNEARDAPRIDDMVAMQRIRAGKMVAHEQT